MADSRLIGQNYSTADLVAKVTGRARYAEDFRAEGMLFCKLLLSPRPHCRVIDVDLREALALPGVHAVLRATDGAADAVMATVRANAGRAKRRFRAAGGIRSG